VIIAISVVFPAPFGPQEDAQLVLLDAEIEIVEDPVSGDDGGQALDLEQRHGV
jgi:hypothetical protein